MPIVALPLTEPRPRFLGSRVSHKISSSNGHTIIDRHKRQYSLSVGITLELAVIVKDLAASPFLTHSLCEFTFAPIGVKEGAQALMDEESVL